MPRKISKKRNKSRNGSKDLANSKFTKNSTISKLNLKNIDGSDLMKNPLKTFECTSPSNKENINSNISANLLKKHKGSNKGLKLKKSSLSRNDLKSIGTETVKLHKKFMNHRANTVAQLDSYTERKVSGYVPTEQILKENINN